MTVSFDQVTILYGDHVAVSDATATLPSGAVGLLGRNGAGKSSILKAILGLVEPASGTMSIEGVPQDADAREVRRFIGYMPEKEAAIPGLNGYETVRLAGLLTGMPMAAASRRAHEVLWLVGLGEQRYRAVSGYSTGMRQKVKLATALVHDPKVLFLDEPTNGLDPDGRTEMLELIDTLAHGMGKSVVLSSHILQDVERVCRDVVLMHEGRVIKSGRMADLTAHVDRVFELQVGGADVDAVERALQTLDIESERANADGTLTITMPEGAELGPLFRVVRGEGGYVRRLVERRHTLEEVFLTAVTAEGAA